MSTIFGIDPGVLRRSDKRSPDDYVLAHFQIRPRFLNKRVVASNKLGELLHELPEVNTSGFFLKFPNNRGFALTNFDSRHFLAFSLLTLLLLSGVG
jgi:hypothetical protein